MSMDDVLNEKVEVKQETKEEVPRETIAEPIKEPETKVEAKVEPEAKIEAKDETIDETTGMTPKEKAFYTKSKDERQKRQESERENAALKARLEQIERQSQQTQPKTEEAKKDFWEDPEAALNRHNSDIARQREDMQRMNIATKLEVSEMLVKRDHPDYVEKLQVFQDLLKTNPQLMNQVLSAPVPAEFVYKFAKNHMEISQAGSLDNLRAKMEAEIRAKVEAELRLKDENKQKVLSSLPNSLTTERSTGGGTQAWSGPPPLDDILH